MPAAFIDIDLVDQTDLHIQLLLGDIFSGRSLTAGCYRIYVLNPILRVNPQNVNQKMTLISISDDETLICDVKCGNPPT
jgi:hypothetical protein